VNSKTMIIFVTKLKHQNERTRKQGI